MIALRRACGLHLAGGMKTAKSVNEVLDAFEVSVHCYEITLAAAAFGYIAQNLKTLLRAKSRSRLIGLLKQFIIALLESKFA